ncbi:MAG: hypothetical protein DCC75_12560, partial [Proteobacteria bacterium]
MFVAFVALTSFTCARAQDASISEAQKRKASVEAKLEQARALGVTPAAQDAQLRSTPGGIAALATVSNEEISNGNRSWVLELSGVGQRLQLIFGSQSA